MTDAVKNESPAKKRAAKPVEASADESVTDLLERLRAKVEERRRAGQYAEDLEESMDEHFRRIVHHRAGVATTEILESDINSLDSHATFSRARMPVASSIPGGSVLHRAINKALARQSSGILQQVQEFADATRRAIRSLGDAVVDPSTHTHGDLLGQIEAIVERLDSYERSPSSDKVALGDLRRRVEELEKAQQARSFKPWFKYEDFESEVGRSREALVDGYRATAELMGKSSPVLDIGCGRGEFLELMTEMGIECWGVELDGEQAEEARQRGYNVVAGDGLEVLANAPDGSLGGISLIQVAEHLSAQQLMDLARISYDKMRPGGRMIIETPNPLSLYVHAYAFFLDPTHDHLVHPIYMRFLFEQAGFSEVRVEWTDEPPTEDQLQPVDDDPNSVANQNVERVNKLLFAKQNYMLIITR